MASYNVHRLDLSNLQESAQLEPHNRPVDSIAILSLPAGAALSLSLGGGPFIPVYAGFAVDICPAELAGIQWRNEAELAEEAVILASYGGVRSTGGA